MRSESLQTFLGAAHTAFANQVRDPRGLASIQRIFEALDTAGDISDAPGARRPACKYLAQATDPETFADPSLRKLIEAFRALEPSLTWRPRSGDCTNASPNFAEEHANAMIVGPGGAERRTDVWIGVSLVAPNIRYPDHDHPPEETYLVLSEGDFMQGQGHWITPGIGGTLYNPPGILHAMQSGAAPLFAFWALWAAPHGA
ncbi:Dimethlysulfonioproprionate lyase [Roseovarius nanhaiticus]|uniref:Dimethlysulfonioproprionate lyase n=1 Tax=Roseovarius nanhaiticus TaxID=573024 RepID=A0A1N7EKY6_9RHOB|nr:dimethylsulfonioproprionate lyase family protein [Roseovarius nanhaiticus]SEK72472.1 Dimethlysulfonioproprionate lyase [Roseovarius nanhaiticus]SIR88724.1 Dimethlysulfonioproprionate lyase [Roseovarius nanhaiticus]